MEGKYQAYPEYADSGISSFNAIPIHWSTQRVNYLFTFGRGLNITKANLEDTGVACVSYGEVHSKYAFEVDPNRHVLKCVSSNYLSDSSRSLLSPGDFVFADTSEDIDGAGNFTQFVGEGQLFAGYHTVILRPKGQHYPRYLAYAFDTPESRNQIRLAVKGVKVFSITQEILKNVFLVLPTHIEQRTIAAFLDHETARIDRLIEKQQRLIELLKEKRQAVISHAVTKGLDPNVPMKDSGVEWLGQVPEHWQVLPIQRVLAKIEQGASPVAQNRSPETGEYGVLKISSVKKGRFIEVESKTLDSFADYEPRFKVKLGDLLVTRANTPSLVADSCIVEQEPRNPTMMCDLVYRLITTNMVENSYVCFWLLSNYGRMQIEVDARGSSMTMAKVSQGHIKSWLITIPPLREQSQIVSYIRKSQDRLTHLIERAELAIKLIQERRTALISAAVTGKIDVRNWQPSTSTQAAEPDLPMA
ncbi:hypothetical protein GCM10009104_05490 [Marinobacterium maritimum]|uniref:Type I restriction modification DNA specificity domain-containing protein n=1 Tax=Marinobacterium maritimum TaxID=500162 RepID=A0ABN1I2F0_9GAMM